MNEIFEEVVISIEEGLYSVINRPDIVMLNLIAFVLLVLIIKKYFWSKVTTFLEARQAALTEALDTAESERAHARELQEKSVKDYEAMKEETRQLKEKLTLEAYKQQDEMITNAKKEAKRRLDQAEKDIDFVRIDE